MNLLFERFHRVAAATPDALAMALGDDRTSFSDLAQRAQTMRSPLEQAGVGPGRPIVVSAPNGADVAAAVVAAWGLGSLPVFVSPNAPHGHLDHAIGHSHAAAVLTGDAGITAAPMGSPHPDLTPDVGSVVFTSGSTGKPKGVMQSHANLLDGAERIGRLNGYGPGDLILCPVPWSHDYGWGQLLSCLVLGQGLVLPAAPSVQALSDAIELHRPTVLAGTPSVYAGMLYGISDIRNADLSSVVKATSTGSNLSPELAEDLAGLLPGVQIYANYGLTETYRSCCLTPDLRIGREKSVGRPVEGVSIRIVDADGSDLPPNSVGQVVHSGAGRCLGYLGDPERTAASRHQSGGILTGDMGYLDEDGFLFLRGRRDRVIKSMDVQVSLDEVEQILGTARMTRQLAVIARPHKVFGMKIEAHVVLKRDEDKAAFKKSARQALSKFQLPREFHFVEALPMTPSGKIDYVTLSQ